MSSRYPYLVLRVGIIGLPLAIACARSGPPQSATRSAAAAEASSAQPSSAAPGEPIRCDRILEDFSDSRIGKFPAGWTARDTGDRDWIQTVDYYRVEAEGDERWLHASYQDHTVTIGRKVPAWDLSAYPILEWRWRVVRLPSGGNETVSSLNDSAAAVYVVWDVGFPFYVRGIKYAWSTTLPEGMRHSKRFGYDRLVVMESGAKRLGQWRTVRVDVARHYAEFFGAGPADPPDGIALMTDADSTDGQAEAFFAGFRLCRYVR